MPCLCCHWQQWIDDHYPQISLAVQNLSCNNRLHRLLQILLTRSGIDAGCVQSAVPHQIGDCFQPHTSIHQVLGERMSQHMRCEVLQPSYFSNPRHNSLNCPFPQPLSDSVTKYSQNRRAHLRSLNKCGNRGNLDARRLRRCSRKV
jgi:hypothetical protein